ncbi:thiol-disulfide oxidoreductase LTO1 [Impatiens glandulifera]|uniref:thiol-disulfide oxidoreductase LTO1 n=1 Tax=Impatiens glandulifera TaxID=253017 RepID=UPI001FB17389|nr:thiol-disulfide oxidoreductase LTO1 [Impatiens glandulifera]
MPSTGVTAMASFFVNISPAQPFVRTPFLSLSPNYPALKILKTSGWSRRVLMLRVNCSTEPDASESDSSSDPSESSSSLFPSSSSSPSSMNTSAYSWISAIGGIGLLNTGYLSYLKLTDSDAFCPIGGGSCGDILNSAYAAIFGVPLSLIGMAAYALVAIMGLELVGTGFLFKMDKPDARIVLLVLTTAMASASTYFLYILGTEFAGVSCPYCLLSAFLSISLLVITLKDLGLQEIQKVVGLQVCLAALVIGILSTSHSAQTSLISSAEINLEPFTTEVTTESSPLSIALAKHLHNIGAKVYGAFWCSHCLEQKEMFGREASKLLDFVECFPNGYKKGTKIEKACSEAGIEGFPTWVINGEVLSGEQQLSELARLSGFTYDDSKSSPQLGQ